MRTDASKSTGLRLLWRVVLAAFMSFVFSLIIFVLVAAGPIWALMLLYGRQAVNEAPAHGGGVLFASVPAALCLASICWPLTGLFLFERWR